MLLHWCILEPSGSSNLAAVRFTSPVHVQSICVFPTGAKPFTDDPEIVARTEPEAFFLDVFFNAHPIHTDAKLKQKAANALVPSVIAYTGGQMEFNVGMGAERATRLMIVKGPFQSVAMAIYGDLVADSPPPLTKYESNAIPSVEPLPLSQTIDPSNSADPTLLARQLLTLIPNSPALPFVISIMFCLKLSDDDWEHPDFPYVFANLEEELVDLDLEKAYQCTSKLIPDNCAQDLLQRFSEKVTSLIVPKDNEQSYLVAGILRNAACQFSDLLRHLLEHLQLPLIFDSTNMDDVTLCRLLDASANAGMARHLNTEWFLGLLRSIQNTPSSNGETQIAASRLAARVQGWHILEDALSNTQADFNQAANMMKDIGDEEQSFGIWLQSMISNPDLITKLSENPVLPISQAHPPLLLGPSLVSVSHDEFISFVRAFIGVCSVVSVYAWADSLPNKACRERSLGVLRLWQTVDGYREMTNHLLLLVAFRLKGTTTYKGPPTQSGVHAENLILSLANEPRAILNLDLMDCILSLRPPLAFIAEDERMSLRKMAEVANDGLPAAFQELTSPNESTMHTTRLRTLRVALAVVEQELDNGTEGEWHVLELLWKNGSYGLVSRLVDILIQVSIDLRVNFAVTPPVPMNHELVHQLFRAAVDVLRLVIRLSPTYTLTSRSRRSLVVATTDIFVCTDAADMGFTQGSCACIAAQDARQVCIDLVRTLSDSSVDVEHGRSAAEHVLQTLLEHGVQVQSDSADPVYHVLQVFCLIDHLLPLPPLTTDDGSTTHWVTLVLPNTLPQLMSFFRVLDLENKVHFVKRLVTLDGGIIGIGEWLLLEELREVTGVILSLNDSMMEDHHRVVGHYQISLSIRLIFDILTSQSSASSWCMESFATVQELGNTFASCLMALHHRRISCPLLTKIAQVLVSSTLTFNADLTLALILTLYRAVQHQANLCDAAFGLPLQLLNSLPAENVDVDAIQLEMGRAIASLGSTETLSEATAEAILSTLEWLSDQPNATLKGITCEGFSNICDRLSGTLLEQRTENVPLVASKITPQPSSPPVCPLTLPSNLSLSLNSVSDLLRPPLQIPSTPERTTSEEVFNLVAVSPPTALLRSPSVVTGLTRTYLNNDFRQLRSLPSSTRQNTSRLPSMHVDEFEFSGSSPPLVPVPAGDVFQPLSPSPTFNATQSIL